MCGIIGIVSNKPVSINIVNSLKKLEYRGYDSAGLATLINNEIVGIKMAIPKTSRTIPITIKNIRLIDWFFSCLENKKFNFLIIRNCIIDRIRITKISNHKVNNFISTFSNLKI